MAGNLTEISTHPKFCDYLNLWYNFNEKTIWKSSNLAQFIDQKAMLSDEDIKKITKAQIEAQKEIFYAKEDLDKKFSSLQTSVDAIAKDNLTKSQEIPVINNRLEKAENWINKAAPNLGVKFVR